MPKLIIQVADKEWTAELREGSNVIGRSEKCGVPVRDPSLSREHCEIVLTGPVATILDKGSMNGTLVNGKRVYDYKLQPGDRIGIGNSILWFEMKKPAHERKESAAARSKDTRRTVTPAADEAEAATVRPGTLLVPDYSAWGRAPRSWGKPLAALGALAAAAALALVVIKSLPSGGGGAPVDPDSVVRNGTFDFDEGGRPAGWVLRGKPQSTITLDPAQGRNGGSCLALDRTGGPADLLVECGFADEILLVKGSSVVARVFTRFDGFGGAAALKVDWLRSTGGPTLGEELSPPVSKCQSWTEVQHTFAPPAGAGAFRVGLVTVGHAGRVYFDDVLVRVAAGAGPGREHPVGAHRVAATKEGVLQVGLKSPRSILDLHARLESDKEGALPQPVAREVALTVEGEALTFNGKMLSPAGMREVEFVQRVSHKEGETAVVYSFKGADLRQLDRVSLPFSVPRTDLVHGIPEAADQSTGRIALAYGDQDLVIEFRPLARVRRENVKGWMRVNPSFAVDPTGGDATFELRIREAPPGSQSGDPLKVAVRLRAERKFGEALKLLKDSLPKLREPARRDEADAGIRTLEDLEKREWNDVQARVFQAWLTRRADQVSRAFQAVELYQRQWTGVAEFVGKGDDLVDKFRKDVSDGTGDAEVDRPRRVLERAKQYADGGRRTLAQKMLQSIVARYPNSDAAPQAQELLKALSGSQE